MDRHAPEPSAQITLLLRKWQGGDRAAVKREWAIAKRWLFRALTSGSGQAQP